MREPAGGSAAAGVRGVAPLSDRKSQFPGGTRGPYSQAWGWRMWYLGEVVCPVIAGAGQRNVMDGKGLRCGGVAVYAVSVSGCVSAAGCSSGVRPGTRGGGSAEGQRMGRKVRLEDGRMGRRVRLEKTAAERPPCSLLRVVICSRHAHHSPGLQLNSAAPQAKVDGPPAAAPT